MADGSSLGRIIRGTLQDCSSFDLCIFSQEQPIDTCALVVETYSERRTKSRHDPISNLYEVCIQCDGVPIGRLLRLHRGGRWHRRLSTGGDVSKYRVLLLERGGVPYGRHNLMKGFSPSAINAGFLQWADQDFYSKIRKLLGLPNCKSILNGLEGYCVWRNSELAVSCGDGLLEAGGRACECGENSAQAPSAAYSPSKQATIGVVFVTNGRYHHMPWCVEKIASTDVRLNPIVRFNYFSAARDVEKCVNGTGENSKDVLRTRTMDIFKFDQWFGGRDFRYVGPALPVDESNDALMKEFCYQTVNTVGTTMVAVVRKVVDQNLSAGIDGLRVVDSSIFRSVTQEPILTLFSCVDGGFVGRLITCLIYSLVESSTIWFVVAASANISTSQNEGNGQQGGWISALRSHSATRSLSVVAPGDQECLRLLRADSRSSGELVLASIMWICKLQLNLVASSLTHPQLTQLLPLGMASLCSSMARNVAQADAVKAGKWLRSKYVGVSLVGKTLAVMGFLVKLVRKLLDVQKALVALLTSSHSTCLLTPATNKVFNDDTFAKMKKGVRLINVARGGVIDEDALVRV
ncbi:hypothetical protein HAX54_025578 [Datura stramonium]|uniref:Glucose-methanol-choline oxidoreductase C-terminal domain-containing protein n=1 Tax=Datura stramonium TaxID=4076 RepID=A0ABS8S6Q2_DATST|nr:hypothetical protein [Datura stramonium]